MKLLKIIIICFINCFLSFSQEEKKIIFNNKTLSEALSIIEERYQVKFSYNNTIIQNKTLNLSFLSLEEFFFKSASQTELTFKKINNRYYIIQHDDNIRKISFCGYLRDDLSNKKLAGIYFQVKSKNRPKKTYKTSNSGFFILSDLKDAENIQLKIKGYKTTEISIDSENGDLCDIIFLEKDDIDLEEVLITEYLTDGITKNINSGPVKIKPRKLGVLPRLVEPDVLQTLQTLPGIQSPSETASGLHIRGGTPDHNLILWDGIPMYSSGHFFDLLSIFNPYITDEIKLYRNNTDLKYGNRISSVIDISTNNEPIKDIKAGFGFNMTNVDAYLETPVDEDFGIVISFRRAFTDFLETKTFNNYSDRALQGIRFFASDGQLEPQETSSESEFYFSDYSIKGLFDLSEDGTLSISSLFTDNQLDYQYDIIESNIFDQPIDIYQFDELRFRNKGLSIEWNKKTNKVNFYSKAYFSSYEMDYSGKREYATSNDNNIYFIDDIEEVNSIRDYGYLFNSNYQISRFHSIQLGYEFNSIKLTYTADYIASNLFFDQSGNNNTHAFFGKYGLAINEYFNLDLGLRSNYFSIEDNFLWEPRINLSFKILQNLRGKISGERKYQILSQIANYLPNDFNIENQVWLLSNSENINALKNNQVSLGLIFKNNTWLFDLEGFYKHTKGLTAFANGFNGVIGEPFDGSSSTRGVDVLCKFKSKDYSSWISYAYSKQLMSFARINEGKKFPGNFDISHSLSWTHNYSLGGLEISLGWNIRTGRPFTPALSEVEESSELYFINYEPINSDRLETYHRLDAALAYRFSLSNISKWRGKIAFSLYNIYNRQNVLNRTYSLVTSLEEGETDFLVQQLDTFSAGITPNLSLRVSF